MIILAVASQIYAFRYSAKEGGVRSKKLAYLSPLKHKLQL